MIDAIALRGGIHIMLSKSEKGDGWNVFELERGSDINTVRTDPATPGERWFATLDEAAQYFAERALELELERFGD